MPDKLTDKEIVKALEDWRKEIIADYQRLKLLDAPMDCFEESHANTVTKLSNALDLINRQNAENERLKELFEHSQANYWNISNLVHKYRNKAITAKAEAYKECIEKAKEIMQNYCGEITEDDLDNILKEMGGEK